MTKYIATKNTNKTEDKHPDFRLYKRDSDDEIIKETYTKKDGTQGEGWKAFGAIWCKIEDGKLKSMSVSIDDEVNTPAVSAPQTPVNNVQPDVVRDANGELQAVYPDDAINPEDLPF